MVLLCDSNMSPGPNVFVSVKRNQTMRFRPETNVQDSKTGVQIVTVTNGSTSSKQQGLAANGPMFLQSKKPCNAQGPSTNADTCANALFKRLNKPNNASDRRLLHFSVAITVTNGSTSSKQTRTCWQRSNVSAVEETFQCAKA